MSKKFVCQFYKNAIALQHQSLKNWYIFERLHTDNAYGDVRRLCVRPPLSAPGKVHRSARSAWADAAERIKNAQGAVARRWP